MKIKTNHYRILREKIYTFLLTHPKITQGDCVSMRNRWDIYWASGTPITNAQEFNYLNDNHIDTAIKAILREYFTLDGIDQLTTLVNTLDHSLHKEEKNCL